jgi:hypothetical protein
LDCGHSWIFTLTERIKKNVKMQIVRDSMERASIRILARRFKKSKTTITNIIHTVCEKFPDSVEVAKKLNPKWSGVLVIDGKWIKAYDLVSKRIKLSKKDRKRLHRFVWMIGIDSGTGDIPLHSIAEEETKIDIMMYFKQLKTMKYPLVAVISDGIPWYGEAAKKVFGEHIIVQRCTRHFLQRCRDVAEKDEKKDNISKTKMLIYLIKKIIEADNLEEAKQWLDRLKRNKHILVKTKIQKWIVKRFKQEVKYLTAYLLETKLDLPHTNNDVENLIGQAEKRLTSIGRFSHWTNAKYYLNAWTLWRRFTPYTDCKGQRKYRNGKSPIELAGVDTSKTDWLKF